MENLSAFTAHDETRALFEGYFNRMTDGYCIIRLLFGSAAQPVDIALLEANEAFEEITGFQRARVVGRKATEILPFVDPRWLNKVGNLASSGEVLRFSGYNTGMLRWLNVQIYPLKTDDMLLVIFSKEEKRHDKKQLKEIEKASFIRELASLERIGKLYQAAMECGSEKELAALCLDAVLEATGSPQGFMGLVGGAGVLDGVAVRYAENTGGRTDKRIRNHDLVRGPGLDALYAGTLLEGRSVLVNNPHSSPDGCGMPHGHIALCPFLGVPLKEKGRVVGIVAVANRESEYTEKDKATLEGLGSSIVEVLMRWRAEDGAHRHGKFKETVLTLARDFINMPFEQIDEGIASALMLVGKYLGVDRTAVFRYDWDAKALICIYNWVREPERPDDGACVVIPFEAIPELLQCHRQGRVHFTGLPGESAVNYPDTTGAANRHGPVSTATFPLMVDSQPWQALGFSTAHERKDWTEDETGAVSVFGEMLLAVLLRQERERALREAEEKYRAERREYERSLEKKEREYLEIIDSSSEGSFIRDLEKEEIHFSSQWKKRLGIEGLSPAEAMKASISRIHPQDSESVDLAYRRACADKAAKVSMEFRILTQDAGYIWVLGQAKITYDGQGRPVKYYGTHMDITQRKRAEAEHAQRDVQLASQAAQLSEQAGELESKNRLITDFFINISHEFKTPLTILMLGLELLESKLKNPNCTPADMTRTILMMRQNAYRLDRLVSNLLDITKLDAGFMEPKWEKADVVRQLAGLVASTEPFARQKELRLGFQCGVNKMVMSTDTFMLERIFLNLISNAIKHTPAGGAIDVSCSAGEQQLIFSVKDTGEGIPEDKQAIIFDRFRQVDTSLTRRSEGCGIGLALTQSLVNLLGGTITCTSAPFSGAEFTVTLPMRAVDPGRRQAEQSGLQPEKRLQIELSDSGINLI